MNIHPELLKRLALFDSIAREVFPLFAEGCEHTCTDTDILAHIVQCEVNA